ncbi:hypothetical protein D9M68_275130 [compost metagenome]
MPIRNSSIFQILYFSVFCNQYGSIETFLNIGIHYSSNLFCLPDYQMKRKKKKKDRKLFHKVKLEMRRSVKNHYKYNF